MKSLRTFLAAASLTVLLSACSRPASPEVEAARAIAADPAATHEQVALAMVRAHDIGGNLANMSLRSAKATNMWPMLREHLGGKDPTPVVKAKILERMPKHKPVWETNLAAAYGSLLTTDQMRSIAQDGRRSPYYDDMLEAAKLVGPLMRESSKDILVVLTHEAMASALMDAPPRN